jgi:hypothetical protein
MKLARQLYVAAFRRRAASFPNFPRCPEKSALADFP